MAGFNNETVYGKNVNFSGTAGKAGKLPTVTLDGQLMIGSTVAPNIRIGTLSSSNSSITITNGAGTIDLTVGAGSGAILTLTGDTGGARSPTAGNINLFTTGELSSIGSGSTITFKIDGGTTGQLLVAQTGTDAVFASSDNADFTFGGANSGATRTFSVTNTSNTASSAANSQITVGGGTAADPQTTYTVTGVTSWSTGIDNSASDAYVVAASTALGTTNVMSMATGGAVSVVLGNLDVTKSASGVDVSTTVSNTSNTASSTATDYITVAGTSAGDARTQYAVAGTTTWTQGIDNSNSDAFVVAASSALGTTDVMRITTGGQVTKPLQSAFFAYLDATVANATGDGTSFILGTTTALTEVFDINGDFVTSGTFTAPVAGIYQFGAAARMSGASAGATASFLTMLIGGVNINLEEMVYTPIQMMNGSVIVSMTAGQTAIARTNVSTGTKTVSVIGDANTRYTYFWGTLLG